MKKLATLCPKIRQLRGFFANRLSFRTVRPRTAIHQKPNEHARHSGIKQQILLYLGIHLRLESGQASAFTIVACPQISV